MTQRIQMAPYVFIGFFALIIIVNLWFLYIAQKNQPGLIVDNSYEKGLQYNNIINKSQEQLAENFLGEIFLHQGPSGRILIFTSNTECSAIYADIISTTKNNEDHELIFKKTEFTSQAIAIQNSNMIYRYQHNLAENIFGPWLLRILCYKKENEGEHELYFSQKLELR